MEQKGFQWLMVLINMGNLRSIKDYVHIVKEQVKKYKSNVMFVTAIKLLTLWKLSKLKFHPNSKESNFY